MTLAQFEVGNSGRIRPQSSFARETERGRKRYVFVNYKDFLSRFGVNACLMKGQADAAFAVSASQKAVFAGKRECGVINETKVNHLGDERLDTWLFLLRPAALADFAAKIARQLCLGRCVARDVG